MIRTTAGSAGQRRSRGIVVAVAAVPVCLLAAACGSGGSTSASTPAASASSAAAPSASAPAAAKDPAIAALVPASIAAKGSVLVAVDASYAPDEYFASDGKTIIGMDADLAHALGQVMGLKFQLQNVGADAIIPGLQSGKYDLSISSWTDTKVREKAVDFVTYYKAGTSFFVKTGSGVKVNTLADLCGHIVGVEKATTQLLDVTAQNGKCKAGGKRAITIQAFPDQNSANLALASGRVQVGMADSPVAAYQVKLSKGAFTVVGQAYGTAPYGIESRKGNGMTKPLLAAVRKLMADGTYHKILAKWGETAGAISDPVINGAIS